jgi:WD40 repeat protein
MGQTRLLTVPRPLPLQLGHRVTPLANAQALLAGLVGPERLVVWDLASGEVRDVAARPAVPAGFALSPDRRLLAIWRERMVTLWGAEDLEARGRLVGDTGDVSALAFTPDGRTLVTGSLGGLIKLWNIRTGKDLGTLERAEGPVNALAFAPDGKELVGIITAPDRRREIRVWSRGDDSRQE